MWNILSIWAVCWIRIDGINILFRAEVSSSPPPLPYSICGTVERKLCIKGDRSKNEEEKLKNLKLWWKNRLQAFTLNRNYLKRIFPSLASVNVFIQIKWSNSNSMMARKRSIQPFLAEDDEFIIYLCVCCESIKCMAKFAS